MDTFRILCWDTEERKWCDTGEEFVDPGAATTHACAEVGMPWVVVNGWYEPVEYGDANGLYEERAKRHDSMTVFNQLAMRGVHLPVNRERQAWYWIRTDTHVGGQIFGLLAEIPTVLDDGDFLEPGFNAFLKVCDIWYYG